MTIMSTIWGQESLRRNGVALIVNKRVQNAVFECILLAKLLDFALLHFVLQGQICLLLQVSLEFLLLHSSPL